MDLEKTDKIVYRFQDSSVPPPYHRSYEYVVTPNSISNVVDSYGDIISESQKNIDLETFKRICKTIEEADLSNCTENKDMGCTGGTSVYIDLFQGDAKMFSGYVYFCGGEEYGNIDLIKSNLQNLLPTKEKP